MRASLGFACALALVAGCSDSTTTTDLGAPDLSTPDLAPAKDLSAPDYTGVGCGSMTCGGTQECCVSLANGQLGQTCVAKGSCNPDAGAAAFTCDGPEDCSAGSGAGAGCCATLGGNLGSNADAGLSNASGGGSAMCTAQCAGSVAFDMDNGTFEVHTKLCHANTDCNGFNGSVLGTGYKFDSCCSAAMAGNYHFCFSSLAGSLTMGAITCN
jgi:hypothetical protein